MVLQNLLQLSDFHLQMEMLLQRQNEERQRFRAQMDDELQAQREQLNNMLEANMKQARNERQEFMEQNQDLKNQLLQTQKANEENIKMIKELHDLVAKQQEEKRLLNAQMERAQAAREREELMERMEAKHKEEQEKLRSEMEAKMEAHRQALAQEYQQAAAEARMERMEQMQQQLDDVEAELEEVKKPGFLERACIAVKDAACAVVTGVVKAGAAVVSKVKENCSVM